MELFSINHFQLSHDSYKSLKKVPHNAVMSINDLVSPCLASDFDAKLFFLIID
ncbi:hypothetical protein JHK86_004823 [Glycine max]|nr:hypothetical protein JHK86_004823 [Glycine max]